MPKESRDFFILYELSQFFLLPIRIFFENQMKNKKQILFGLLMLPLLRFPNFQVSQCHAQDKMNGPNKFKSTIPMEKYGEGSNLFFNFYQNWISPVRGSRCPMYPSCSQYAKKAFHVLPWYEAYPASFERLLRCGHELHLYRKVMINRVFRWYDPVIVNGKKHYDEYFEKRELFGTGSRRF